MTEGMGLVLVDTHAATRSALYPEAQQSLVHAPIYAACEARPDPECTTGTVSDAVKLVVSLMGFLCGLLRIHNLFGFEFSLGIDLVGIEMHDIDPPPVARCALPA